jgi:hypothetical protein
MENQTATLSSAPATGATVNGGSIKLTKLLAAVQAVQCAMSKDKNRYILNGIYLKSDSEKSALDIVATDGKRLHLVTVKVEQLWPGMSAIISAGNVAGLVKFLKANKKKGDLVNFLPFKQSKSIVNNTASGQSDFVKFTIGQESFIAQCVEGNYPNYRQVIPKKESQDIKLALPDLREAVSNLDKLTDRLHSEAVQMSSAQLSDLAARSGDFAKEQGVKYLLKQVKDSLKDTFERDAGVRFDIIDCFTPYPIKKALKPSPLNYSIDTVPTFLRFDGEKVKGEKYINLKRGARCPQEYTAVNPTFLVDGVEAVDTFATLTATEPCQVFLSKYGKDACGAFVHFTETLDGESLTVIIMPQRIAH